VDGIAVGFVAYELNAKDRTEEVLLLAVHPDYQNRGIGTELNKYPLARMVESGIVMAKVETGGDPAHAPARGSVRRSVTGRCRRCVISWIFELPGDVTHDGMTFGALWQEAKWQSGARGIARGGDHPRGRFPFRTRAPSVGEKERRAK
jgi:hypothetical protein